MVLDLATHEGLPGVTVLLDGTTIYTSTAADGSFDLRIPAAGAASVAQVKFSSIGYVGQTRVLAVNGEVQTIKIATDTQVLGGLEVCYALRKPWPWHPRCLYSWGKYWLTRPFRR